MWYWFEICERTFSDWLDFYDLPMTIPDLRSVDSQLSCANYLKWLVDGCNVAESEVTIHGWVLPYPAGVTPTFLLNGEPFAHVEWPLDSKEMRDTFDHVPGAEKCRYTCTQPIVDQDDLYPNGFARFDLVGNRGGHARSYRHAWYFADPRDAAPVPDGERIKRVIGVADAESYLWGGATTACRFDEYLEERFDKPLSDYRNILDWAAAQPALPDISSSWPTPR
jgi:hypothetical protein